MKTPNWIERNRKCLPIKTGSQKRKVEELLKNGWKLLELRSDEQTVLLEKGEER